MNRAFNELLPMITYYLQNPLRSPLNELAGFTFAEIPPKSSRLFIFASQILNSIAMFVSSYNSQSKGIPSQSNYLGGVILLDDK